MESPAARYLEPAPQPVEVVREKWALHVVLFFATFATVLGVQLLERGVLTQALAFAFSLLGVLLCHEMGHYIVGRLYGVSISPPYFIPVPLGPIGTLGAVIRIRSDIPNRNALVDIGAAGPLAGVVVAIPLLIWGTAHSKFVPVHYVAGLHLPGELSLWNLGHVVAHGGWQGLKEFFSRPGEAWEGDSPLTWICNRVLLGATPAGMDVQLHPVAEAAWWGLLVTWLNLLPIGQLDGGHVMHALFGRRARWVGNGVHVFMIGLVIWASVMVIPWLLLTRYLVGIDHPPVTEPEVPMSRSRYLISALAIVLLVLTFIPVPLEWRFTS